MFLHSHLIWCPVHWPFQNCPSHRKCPVSTPIKMYLNCLHLCAASRSSALVDVRGRPKQLHLLKFPVLILSSLCGWPHFLMVESFVLIMLCRAEAGILQSKFVLQFFGQVGRSLLIYFPSPHLLI